MIGRRPLFLLLSLAAAVAALLLSYQLLSARRFPVVRFSAGRSSTTRHEMAATITQNASKWGVRLELVNSAGTVECLERLEHGELDLALVNSGVVLAQSSKVRVVCALGVEPVHLLLRDKPDPGISLRENLVGKSIGIGERGSTEWLVAYELIRFERLQPIGPDRVGDVQLVEYKKDDLANSLELIKASKAAKRKTLIDTLPDCFIIQGALPSKIVQQLVEVTGFHLESYSAAQAFRLQSPHTETSTGITFQPSYIEAVEVPPQAYFSPSGRVPTQKLDTLGARLILVAGQDVPSQVVANVAKSIFESHLKSHLHPTTPQETATPYQPHSGSEEYFLNSKSLTLDQLADIANQVFGWTGAAFAGAASIYGYLWSKKARQPDDYFRELHKIDENMQHRIAQGSVEGETTLSRTRKINDRLDSLRRELLADICQGKIKNELGVSLIIALMKECRDAATNGDSASTESTAWDSPKATPRITPRKRAA